MNRVDYIKKWRNNIIYGSRNKEGYIDNRRAI
jgi:hypothetical protein